MYQTTFRRNPLLSTYAECPSRELSYVRMSKISVLLLLYGVLFLDLNHTIYPINYDIFLIHPVSLKNRLTVLLWVHTISTYGCECIVIKCSASKPFFQNAWSLNMSLWTRLLNSTFKYCDLCVKIPSLVLPFHTAREVIDSHDTEVYFCGSY